MPFASSRMSPGCSIPVAHAAWWGNSLLMRIRPGKGALESDPPDTDRPRPRVPFGTCTRNTESENEKEEQDWVNCWKILSAKVAPKKKTLHCNCAINKDRSCFFFFWNFNQKEGPKLTKMTQPTGLTLDRTWSKLPLTRGGREDASFLLRSWWLPKSWTTGTDCLSLSCLELK